jgi:hypothetical protein
MGVPVPDINDIFITHLHVGRGRDRRNCTQRKYALRKTRQLGRA